MAWCWIEDKPLFEPTIPLVYWRVFASLVLDELIHLPMDKNARLFADDIFRCIFVNDKFCIKISLKFVPKSPIDNWFR